MKVRKVLSTYIQIFCKTNISLSVLACFSYAKVLYITQWRFFFKMASKEYIFLNFDLLISFKHFKIGTMANNNDIKQLKTDIVLIIHTRQYPIANPAKMLGITNPLSSVNPVAFSLSISLHSRLLDFKCSIHVAIILLLSICWTTAIV